MDHDLPKPIEAFALHALAPAAEAS